MSEESNKPNDPNNGDKSKENSSNNSASQLDLTNELNKVLSQVSERLERINQLTKSQSDIILSMTNSFQSMENNFSSMSLSSESISENLINASDEILDAINPEGINNINESLKKVSDTASKGLTNHSQNLTDLKKGLLDTSEGFIDVGADLINVNKDIDDVSTKVSDDILTFRKNTVGMVVETSKFAKALMWLGEKLKNLMSGISGSIKNIVKGGFAIVKGLFNAITSLVGAATQLLKFSLTLPFTIAQKAAEVGNVIRTELVEVIQQAGEDLKEHFDFNSSIGEGIRKMTARGKGMLLAFQSPSSELVKLFGMGSAGIANMIKEVGNNVNAMGHFSEIFGRSIMGNERRTKNFTKMVRAFGFSAEDIHYMALDASNNLEHINTRMAKLGVVLSTVATEYGVDRKRLSKNFMILRKDIIQFGHLSDEEIARTTAQLTQMRVKLEDASAVFKKFSTFEDAANSVAILSQTFGMNLDAFDIIQAKNPEEIISMFRNSMLETGRSFEDLNRFEKDLMAQHTGMSAESLAALMNYRDLGLTHEEAVRRMESERPEAKQMASLKKLNSAIKEVQKVMTFDSPLKAFGAGMAANTSMSGELKDVMVSLSKGYEGIYEYARTLDPDTWSGLIKPINHIIRIMRGIFESRGFKDGLVNTVEIIAGFVGQMFNFDEPVKALHGATATAGEIGLQVANDLDKRAININRENVGNLASLSGRIMGGIIKGAAIGFIAILKTANNGITKLKTMMDATDSNTNLIESFFGWDPGDITNMGTQLKNALLDFFSNSSGMISLTGWILKGFEDIFEIIIGIFGGVIASGIDEIFGTKFSERPDLILKKTSLKSQRKSMTETSSSIMSALNTQDEAWSQSDKDIDKTDLASMLHDLSDKISTVTNVSDRKKLEGKVNLLKSTFGHDDTTEYQFTTIGQQASSLMQGIEGGEYIGGNIDRVAGAERLKTKRGLRTTANFEWIMRLKQIGREFDKTLKQKNPDQNYKELVEGYTLQGSDFMDIESGWNTHMRIFWDHHGLDIVNNLKNSNDKWLNEKTNDKFLKSKVYPEFKSIVLGQDLDSVKNSFSALRSNLANAKPGGSSPAMTSVGPKGVNTSGDLEYLNKLMGISSSKGVLSNLMNSVEIPYLPKESDYEPVSLVENKYDAVSNIDTVSNNHLSKQKCNEYIEKLTVVNEEVKAKKLEVNPEFVFDSATIDKLMKTMASSNLVRILGMPEYTNGVMSLVEDAIGSRCFNVGSDGTAATPEVIQPSN
jgi:hypothetical protein